MLKATAGELQHEISSLRFMGRWPEIRFVRDVYMENYEEVIKIIDGLDLNEGNQDFSSDSNMNDKHVIFQLHNSL